MGTLESSRGDMGAIKTRGLKRAAIGHSPYGLGEGPRTCFMMEWFGRVTSSAATIGEPIYADNRHMARAV